MCGYIIYIYIGIDIFCFLTAAERSATGIKLSLRLTIPANFDLVHFSLFTEFNLTVKLLRPDASPLHSLPFFLFPFAILYLTLSRIVILESGKRVRESKSRTKSDVVTKLDSCWLPSVSHILSSSSTHIYIHKVSLCLGFFFIIHFIYIISLVIARLMPLSFIINQLHMYIIHFYFSH